MIEPFEEDSTTGLILIMLVRKLDLQTFIWALGHTAIAMKLDVLLEASSKITVMRAVTVLRILLVSLMVRGRLGNPFGYVTWIYPLRICDMDISITYM